MGARYEHASLYMFDAEARTAVINQFNTALNNNVAIRCRYIEAHHLFYLECPSTVGSEANEALEQVINSYIEKELDAAEREDREPRVQQFHESQFDSLDNFFLLDDDPPPLEDARITDTHLIMVGGSDANLIARFRLHQLPLLERTLAPSSQRVAKLFTVGYTWRAVCWNKSYGYVFNGRIGHPRDGNLDPGHQLDLPEFEALHDERDLKAIEAKIPVKKWEFEGHPVTVEQWAQGMGRTKQVRPDEKPEPTKDAIKYLAKTDHQTSSSGLGRARVPKGASVLPEEGNIQSSEEEERAGRSRRSDFNALLSGTAAPEDDSESSDVQQDSSDDEDAGPKTSFASLLPINQQRQGPMKRRDSLDWNAVAARPKPTTNSAPTVFLGQNVRVRDQRDTSYASDPAPPSVAEPTHEEDELPAPQMPEISVDETPSTNEQFVSFGKPFAKVDDIGLTANAGNTAEWEDAHHTSRKPRGRALPVTSRQASLSKEAGSARRSSVADSNVPGRQRKTAAHTWKKSEAPNGEWDDKNKPPEKSQGRLVDVSVKESHRGPPKPPPGYFLQNTPAPQPIQTKPLTQPTVQTADLIDSNEKHRETKTLPVRSAAGASNPYNVLSEDIADDDDGSDDEVDEHGIKALPPNYGYKRNTMRQKAGKKAIKSKAVLKDPGKAKVGKAVFDLPEPPPPPKPKKVEEPKLTGIQKHLLNLKATKELQATSQPAPVTSPTSSPLSPALPFESITNVSHPFGRLLHQKTNAASDDDSESDCENEEPAIPPKLVAHVGTLLNLSSGDFGKGKNAIPAETVQQELKKPTDTLRAEFLPRLSTSSADAKYLLELSASGQDAVVKEAVYEIFVQDTAGTMLKVTMPSDGKAKYSVETHDQILGDAYCHYPVHVWDVRFRLLKPGNHHNTPATDALKEFVRSLKTEGIIAPSIRGMIVSGQFTVEKALTKQAFTHYFDDGVNLKVTRVQDLFLESLEDPYHNFRAVVKQEKVMLECQRIWWEACWETENLLNADIAQAKVDEMVRAIDSVGVQNEGPLRATTEADTAAGDEQETEEDEWFW